MHEVGIAESVIDIVERTAREHGLAAVCRVVLEIGGLSGVDAQSLEFALSVLTPGTLLDGAEIELLEPANLLRCRLCGSDYEARAEQTDCPGCGAADFEVIRGREMLVMSVAGE